MCKSYLTQTRDLRLRLEGCKDQTVVRFRQPVGEEPLRACAGKAAEQKVTSQTGQPKAQV